MNSPSPQHEISSGSGHPDSGQSVFVTAQDGLRLHVRRYGQRKWPALPVLCLPGLARTAADFEALVHALSSDAKQPRAVFALDYRGRGQSDYDRDVSHYSFQTELADVLAVIAALGVSSLKRSSGAPDVPTIAESGYPGFEAVNCLGLLVPARTPAPLVNRLNADVRRVFQQPDVEQKLAGQGGEAATGTPEAFAAYLKSETAKWAKVIKASGVKPE